MNEPQPHIEFIDDKRVRLLSDFNYTLYVGQEEYHFHIPKGFVTDGASVPKIFWGFPFYFTPFQGKVLPGAVCHDFMYSKKFQPRYLADWFLYKIMGKYGVGMFKRLAYFVAVRLGGSYK